MGTTPLGMVNPSTETSPKERARCQYLTPAPITPPLLPLVTTCSRFSATWSMTFASFRAAPALVDADADVSERDAVLDRVHEILRAEVLRGGAQ